MIHLISVFGKRARSFYLEPINVSDFKSLIGSIVGGKVMIISTKFRTDVIYSADESHSYDILKIWMRNATPHDVVVHDDVKVFSGDEEVLQAYFQSINVLAANWHQYGIYQKAFNEAFLNDKQNPIALKLGQCDLHVLQHPSICRAPLLNMDAEKTYERTESTYLLAMDMRNNRLLSN